MGVTDTIKARILGGERPYGLTKEYNRTTVYGAYNRLIQDGYLTASGLPTGKHSPTQQEPPEQDSSEPQEVPEVEVPSYDTPEPDEGKTVTFTTKRATPTAKGNTPDVIDFSGKQNLPKDAVSAVRSALGMALVPSVIRMPMPELLYTAMVTSISEFGWPAMQPQDFIDTVLKEWMEACDVITRPIVRLSELKEIVAKANAIDEKSPALKQYIQDHGLFTIDQAKQILDSQVQAQAAEDEHNGNGNGNGHNGNGHEEPNVIIPSAEIDAESAQPPQETIIPSAKLAAQIFEKVPPPQVKPEPEPRPVTYVQDLKQPQPKSGETVLGGIAGVPLWMVNKLREHGILTIGQLVSRTHKDIATMKGMGDLMATKINEWLATLGLALKLETADKLIAANQDKTVGELLDQIRNGDAIKQEPVAKTEPIVTEPPEVKP